MNTAFFLGANTPGGFASFFGEWLDYGQLKRLYILKGTSGNGKSGFMRRVAKKLAAKGLDCESILCSSDPASLDGVYFPKSGVAFVDGTAPHVIEPRYPLAVDCWLPLTQFVDDGALAAERSGVVGLRDGLRDDYTRLSRVLAAVKTLQDEQRDLVLNGGTAETIARRARGFIRREIKKGSGGVLSKRFLSALTPGGETVLWETADALADRIVELRDPFRLSDVFLRPLLEAALDAGQEAVACYDPLAPASRISHLILPGLRLAFTSAAYPGEPYRRVRLDAAVPREMMRRHRLRLRFLRRTEAALTEDARGVLAGARDKHGRLEDIYNPHVDFIGVRALADAYAERVLP
ncbi:MAG: hypothetical protein FWG72_02960 [Oscillospiraceae bacterium]|nr:hypothetical protein [Oscillospiraceae bacterium]